MCLKYADTNFYRAIFVTFLNRACQDINNTDVWTSYINSFLDSNAICCGKLRYCHEKMLMHVAVPWTILREIAYFGCSGVELIYHGTTNWWKQVLMWKARVLLWKKRHFLTISTKILTGWTLFYRHGSRYIHASSECFRIKHFSKTFLRFITKTWRHVSLVLTCNTIHEAVMQFTTNN